MTDKAKLYSFFVVWIIICILILWVFAPAIWIKAILCLNIAGCIGAIRAVKGTDELPPGLSDDTQTSTADSPNDDTYKVVDSSAKEPSAVSEVQPENNENSTTGLTN